MCVHSTCASSATSASTSTDMWRTGGYLLRFEPCVLSTFWTLFFPTWVIENEVTRIGSKRTLTLGRGDASNQVLLATKLCSQFSNRFSVNVSMPQRGSSE